MKGIYPVVFMILGALLLLPSLVVAENAEGAAPELPFMVALFLNNLDTIAAAIVGGGLWLRERFKGKAARLACDTVTSAVERIDAKAVKNLVHSEEARLAWGALRELHRSVKAARKFRPQGTDTR